MARGKGIFVWQVQFCEGGDANQIVAQAQAAGLSHVLVKVSDGVNAFPAPAHKAVTVAAIRALQAAGLQVWGWGYVYGEDPDGEADVAIRRVVSLNLRGFVVDAEGEYRDRPPGTATRYMNRLRAGLPGLPLALSSFRFPGTQGDYPFDEFLAQCQIAMPQVYWVARSGGDPAAQLERSWREYTDRWPHLAYIPTGAAYGEWQGEHEWWWTARPDQITAFLDQARRLGLPAVNFWSWQHARFDVNNSNYPGTELWDAIAKYPWTGGEAAPQPETRLVEALVALKFRSQPSLDDTFWIDQVVFAQGTTFTALGYPTWPQERGGYRFQRVRTMDGHEGWVSHSRGASVYLTHRRQAQPIIVPVEKPVWVIEPLGLKFRSQPSTDNAYWIDQIIFMPGTRLTAIGRPFMDAGGRYIWQKVRAGDGREGYVAYGYDNQVYLSEEKPLATRERATQVWTISDLNVRDAPGLHGNVVWTVAGDIRLEVLEDPATAAAKVGVPGQWLRVRTSSLKEGFVAAWYVTATKPADARKPVRTARIGESRYLYGFHDPCDRQLFGRRRGWILVTEGIGRNPDAAGGNRATYTDWVKRGFGLIARLNNGYDSSGTIPEPPYYDAFAQTCARWVERSLDPNSPAGSCHIWIIGNEMNNPREWPGNVGGVGGRPITPESYADCFNRVYRAIKAVQPDAIVCPGAVDPYYGPGSDNRQWFLSMLARIIELDGIVLHAYTHGSDPALITSTRRFGQNEQGVWTDPDNPLKWQYYHFYAYRTYMEMIPARWRHVPVFITETDQIEPWADVNSGWVRAAYAEIDRWNRQPHAQQIRALLLYRWPKVGDWPNNPNDDRWWIEGKQGVIDDFRAALSKGYRWRA